MNDEELDTRVELLTTKAQQGDRTAKTQLRELIFSLFDEPASDQIEKEIAETIEFILNKLIIENHCEKNKTSSFKDDYLSYFGRSIPAPKSSGGRFYVCGDTQFFCKLGAGKYVLGRLDGMHHGVSAGLTVLTARKYIDDFIKKGIHSPNEIAKRLSDKMYLIPKKGASAFTTLFVSILDDSTAYLSCVGDGQTLFYQAEEDTLAVIKPFGPVIGAAGPELLKKVKYKTEEFVLKKGDVLVSYTDGVNERKGFELSRIDRFIKANIGNIERTITEILLYTDNLLPQGGLADDTTAIGITIHK
ncbi:serine/threonine-protein phosphatase [Candidatus Woesearchaeota archaeon]|nr:serine/threonine-protein phosphatase [Candidatus Woesearchaeota archaeon]